VVVWRVTREPIAVAYVGLNPVMALYVVNGGRNDVLVGLALLVAVVLVRAGRPTTAGVVGALGALVKLTGMVGIVAVLVALVVGGRQADARRLGGAAIGTVVVAYALAGVHAVLTPMDTAGALYSRSSVWRLVGVFDRPLPPTELVLVLLAGFVGWVLLRSARSGPEIALPATLTALTLGASWVMPGYVAWAVPTAALRHRSAVARIAALQSVVLLMTYEVLRWPLPRPSGHGVAEVALVVGPALVLCLAVALLVSLRRSCGHDARTGPADAEPGAPARHSPGWTVSS
jgi:hypothetical protein